CALPISGLRLATQIARDPQRGGNELADREPNCRAGVRALERPALEQPLPGIVGDEGNALDLLANEHGVQPTRFPTVVEPVEQAEVMSVQVYDLQMAARAAHAQRHGAPAREGG